MLHNNNHPVTYLFLLAWASSPTISLPLPKKPWLQHCLIYNSLTTNYDFFQICTAHLLKNPIHCCPHITHSRTTSSAVHTSPTQESHSLLPVYHPLFCFQKFSWFGSRIKNRVPTKEVWTAGASIKECLTADASRVSLAATDSVRDANVNGMGSGHMNYLNSIMRDAFTSSDEGRKVLRTASMGITWGYGTLLLIVSYATQH